MPSYNKSIIIPLDEALEELNKKLEHYKAKNQIKDYNFSIYAFLSPEIHSTKIDNLKPYKSTVRCRKNTGGYLLDINNDSSISDLTELQVKKLQELNDYLKDPDIKKSIKKSKILTLTPCGILIIIMLYFLVFPPK